MQALRSSQGPELLDCPLLTQMMHAVDAIGTCTVTTADAQVVRIGFAETVQ